jgi:hypothetical protein
MQNPKDNYRVGEGVYGVGYDIRGARNHELAGVSDAPRMAYARVLGQQGSVLANSKAHAQRGVGIAIEQVIENLVEVRFGLFTPANQHRRALL